MTKIVQHLWFASDMEAAIRRYTSLIPGSALDWIKPLDPFNRSFSIMVECYDQAEIDRCWDTLCEGGAPGRCGWLQDRWGLSWQIIPKRLGELMSDHSKTKRVTEAMLKMTKFDIAALEAAGA